MIKVTVAELMVGIANDVGGEVVLRLVDVAEGERFRFEASARGIAVEAFAPTPALELLLQKLKQKP